MNQSNRGRGTHFKHPVKHQGRAWAQAWISASGKLFWPQPERCAREWAALAEDVVCEVAIIGGGVTGALVAWHLTQAGIAAVLLDKRSVAAGSTSASTSLLLYELDVPLHELMALRGETEAVRAWQLCREAIGKLAALVKTLGDDCGFAWRPSLYLASNEEDALGLKLEYEARRRHGFDCDWLTKREVEQRCSFSRPAALWTQEAAQLDPWR